MSPRSLFLVGKTKGGEGRRRKEKESEKEEKRPKQLEMEIEPTARSFWAKLIYSKIEARVTLPLDLHLTESQSSGKSLFRT